MKLFSRLIPRKRDLNLLPRKGSLPSLPDLARQWSTLRWAALPIIDRRWAAPLSAAALGMGLFAGVAIGPGVDGVVGAPQQIVEAPPALIPPATPGPGEVASTPPPALTQPNQSKPPATPPASSPPSPLATPPISPEPVTPIVPTTPTDTSTDESTTEEDSTETTSDEGEEEEQVAEDLVLTGTVVQVNPEAESYALTTGSGQMSAVHAKNLPKAGTKLEVAVRELANGTYAEDDSRRVSGKRTSVKLGGLVTFRDPAADMFTVSRRGVSILVHTNPAATPAVETPEVASLVTVSARISPRSDALANETESPETTTTPTTTTTTPTTPTTTTTTTETTTPASGQAAAPPANCGSTPAAPPPPKTVLTATKVSVDSNFLAYGDFQGIVQGVCESKRELLLSADGVNEARARVTFAVPDGIDLEPVDPGQILGVRATIAQGTKALEVSGIARDRGTKEADDESLAQGETTTD